MFAKIAECNSQKEKRGRKRWEAEDGEAGEEGKDGIVSCSYPGQGPREPPRARLPSGSQGPSAQRQEEAETDLET